MDLLVGYLGIVGIILLLLIINRQVIWAWLYNMVSPLIMAGLFYSDMFDLQNIIILTFIVYFSQWFTTTIVKKIYASQILKHVLILRFSIILFFAIQYIWYILWYWSDHYFSDKNTLLLSLGYIILFVSVASKLFAYSKWIITWQWLQYNIRFVILSLSFVWLLSSQSLFLLLSWNLWMLLFISISIIAFWLYDGLQLKEMIRFRKLIWNQRITKKYNKK